MMIHLFTFENMLEYLSRVTLYMLCFRFVELCETFVTLRHLQPLDSFCREKNAFFGNFSMLIMSSPNMHVWKMQRRCYQQQLYFINFYFVFMCVSMVLLESSVALSWNASSCRLHERTCTFRLHSEHVGAELYRFPWQVKSTKKIQ
jgi:hypothetical protein